MSLLSMAVSALAQFDNAGTSAATFLKIGVGARAVSLGGSQVASVNDASALYWNPGGLANINRSQIMFSNNQWIAGIKHNYLAGGFPLGDLGTAGVSISYVSMGDMKVTNWDNTYGTGETFSAYGAAIGLGWARRLSDRFMVGVHAKYVQESIANSSASTVAFDVGSQYDIRWLRIGFSILNFGPQLRLDGRDLSVRVDPFPNVGSNPDDVVANLESQYWSLPILFQLGFAVTPVHNETFRITLTADYRDERDYRPQALGGIEVAVSEMFFVRGGIRNRLTSRIDDNGLPVNEDSYLLTAGIGAAYEIPGTGVGLKFDYAYQELTYFKNAQMVTMTMEF